MGTRETLITPLKSRQRNVALLLTRSARLPRSKSLLACPMPVTDWMSAVKALLPRELGDGHKKANLMVRFWLIR